VCGLRLGARNADRDGERGLARDLSRRISVALRAHHEALGEVAIGTSLRQQIAADADAAVKHHVAAQAGTHITDGGSGPSGHEPPEAVDGSTWWTQAWDRLRQLG
jgi:hypothetical protein